MRATIVFLQNAWSPLYAGIHWPRQSWLRALARSRSGQRLKIMIDDFDCCEDITPEVGATPSSVLPADPEYIRELLQKRKPERLVVCGRHAQRALRELWQGPMLIVPHPAHRLLTNNLYAVARGILKTDFKNRLVLEQKSGSIRITKENING